MIPNMYKIAGELNASVFHVAARSVATQALSIFGDHSDVMAVRPTGFALIASASVQEAHDMALIAQTATLRSRVPFVHFFDGFRTSHEINTLALLSDEQIRSMIDDGLVRAHRARALNPEHPFIRGTAQNPDVFFQAREAANSYHAKVPGIVLDVMKDFADLTGRRYNLFDYDGPPDAERVVISMASGAEVVHETAVFLRARGKRSASSRYASIVRFRPSISSRCCLGPVERSRSSTGRKSRVRPVSLFILTSSRPLPAQSRAAKGGRCRG